MRVFGIALASIAMVGAVVVSFIYSIVIGVVILAMMIAGTLILNHEEKQRTSGSTKSDS